MTHDAELFVLSYAQLAAALLLDPNNEKYLIAKTELEERLLHNYGISHLEIVARSLDSYTLAFHENGEQKWVSFATDEVEDFN
ncbi:hypothetical protein [Sulfoacidibacillus thermotolerans]|uniref:Uncharacterized protein n=1 Tax=Sulfoacidibacillus thermotolerans TaxID=1765684 RepID=A0A2U3DBL7_SULT2|nr:hypothetical protein [Sulfoacidibacillus thermotolerans]PWI58655.1 hypothetical protein BM613_00715 [Sulfoacidibacillus thermotolerans]